MLIRPAQRRDAASIADLLRQLGYPDNEETEVAERITAWEAEPHGVVLVAQTAAGLVGGVLALASVPYFERPGRWGRVVALVVAEHTRGSGIGRALMAEAERIARAEGCIVMEVSSANARTDAHAFYRGIGYDNWADRAGSLRKDLQPGAAAASYAVRFPTEGHDD